MDTLTHLAIFGAVIVGWLLGAVAICAILSKIPFGWLLSLAVGPLGVWGVATWLSGIRHIEFVWAGTFVVIAVTTSYEHETKSGRADRRFKDNEENSGISVKMRLNAILIALSSGVLIAWRIWG